MKKLQIVRVDIDSAQRADLQIGDNIIGGVVTGCSDERVPQHAITINVSDQGDMTITPVALCHMKPLGSTNWRQLDVGSTSPIHAGDIFSLLSDKYWFKIISTGITMEDDESSSKRKAEENATDESSQKKFREDKSIEALHSPNDNLNDIPSSVGVDPGQEEFYPLDDDEEATPSIELIANDIYGASIPEGGKSPEITSSTELQTSGSIVSTKSDEANESLHVKNETIEGVIQQGDATEPLETTTVEETPGCEEAGKKIKWDCGQHFSDRNDQVPSNTDRIADDGQSAESTLLNDTAAPSAATVPSPPPRYRCTYGRKCYRKNLEHKSEFSHPGDPDYDAVDNRPECRFGIRCYRKNPQHRKDFKHTIQRRRRPQTPIRAQTPDTDHSSFEESIDESEYEPSFCTDSSDEVKSDWDDK